MALTNLEESGGRRMPIMQLREVALWAKYNAV